MSDWTSGYVADIGYTYGYYTELNPLRARLAFLNAGLISPEVGSHCELGFGQGLSVNIHAAASGNAWYATDFNPAQVGFARDLASASGASAHLYDEAFTEFCQRGDLPDFDSIGLHGIWSWISDENRTVIVDFIRRKLKVGGVLYISYNTQPGWAATVPLRDLLTEHAEVMGVSGKGIVSRIDEALVFADKLIAVNPAYARVNPQVIERLAKLKEHDRHYLAHEYFNRDWLPMPFSRMAEWLAPARLDYACSAYYPDHLDGLNLSTDQQALIKEIPDRMFRETVRDFCVNQQFRRDYWVKGARKLSGTEHQEALRATRVILATAPADVSLKVTGSLGEADMQEAVYGPILDALNDHQARTLGEIEQAIAGKANLAQLREAAIVLGNSGSLLAVQDEAAAVRARPYCDRLNARLIDNARGSKDVSFLASPVTGGGVPVNRFQQIFLMAIGQGKERPADWAAMLWGILSAQEERLLKDGKLLDTAEANLAELNRQAGEFAEKRLAVLKALHIA
ncbi:MAG: class I SAM-dependent methyltransferase [Proteobacteria bacterium]|nr:class I SAM-dependent methyltransferase [Pseudomonadota bacterium]